MPSPLRYRRRSDAELVAAHLAGDAAAWDSLLERYEGFLFRLVLRMGLSGADADDAFQNVCLKLYLHLEDLRDVEKLSGWLAAIVRQEGARLARRRAAGGAPPLNLDTLPEMPVQDSLPEQVVLAEERIRLVRQALADMPEPCRTLLGLLYGPEPESYTGIAQQLGMPTGSIGPRRARCLERLKKLLAPLGF